MPSEAADIAPAPIDWDKVDRFKVLGGIVIGVAFMMGIPIRWGGDWDGDLDLRDQKLMDYGHIELVKVPVPHFDEYPIYDPSGGIGRG
jgi:peptidoglycan L-alanyl-D-glutamate endopeptidase CwlK